MDLSGCCDCFRGEGRREGVILVFEDLCFNIYIGTGGRVLVIDKKRNREYVLVLR